MTKSELAGRMLEWNNGNPFITVTSIMELFSIGHKKATEVTDDCIPIKNGSGKANRAQYFFIDDVAESIMRNGL